MPYSQFKNRTKHLLFFSLFWVLSSLVSVAQTSTENYKPFLFSLDKNYLSESDSNSEEQVESIISSQKFINDSLLLDIKYWNGAYPSYRWHQIMVEAGNLQKGHKNGGRMAILHLAIYDALAQVWTFKKEKKQSAPFEENINVKKLGQQTDYSTYICEYSATASAAHSIISYYFPEQKAFLNSKLQQYKDARLRTGLQYPSDIALGLSIGKSIAEKYITYAKTDRTNKLWNGTVPNYKNLWSGTPSKWDPMKAQWLPLTLKKADQFRPAPPPEDWTAEMEELRAFNRNNKNSIIAWKWKSEPIWDLLLERKILEYGLNPFEAAFTSALFHSSRFDATIAAWDGKYHYWGIRPFQYDPNFKPILIDTPNFPGYPAGHTTVAGALAKVMSHLFPLDTSYFNALALECSESRFEGGVHFRTDNEVGLKVGQHIIESFKK